MKKILAVLEKESGSNNFTKLFDFPDYKCDVTDSVNNARKLIRNGKHEIIVFFTLENPNERLSFLEEIRSSHDLYFPILILVTKELDNQEIRKILELNVDDILFHPVSKAELHKAIRTQIKKRENLFKYLTNNLSAKSKQNNSINLNEQFKSDYIFLDDKHHPGFYPLKSIIYIKSLGDYTKLCIDGKRKIVLHKTLTFWEEHLPSSTFIRIHRQTIINLNYVETVERLNNYNYKIKLKNVNEVFKISQRYSKKIKNRLGVS